MGKMIIFMATALAITACGGGGGGSNELPANPDAVFSTSDPDTNEVGESKTINLSGRASANGESEQINGSITISRKPNVILDMETVSVTDLIFVVHFPSSGTTISSSNTTYATLAGEFIQSVTDEGVICYPDFNWNELPDTVKYGDAGVLGSSTCTDGTQLSGAYLVEVSDRNNAWAAIHEFVTYSEPGIDDIYEDIVYHISEDGRIRALDISAGDGTVSFELSS